MKFISKKKENTLSLYSLPISLPNSLGKAQKKNDVLFLFSIPTGVKSHGVLF